MKYILIVFGKVKDTSLKEKIDYYVKRIPFISIQYLKEDASRKDLLTKLAKVDYVIALSEEGLERTSVDFSKHLVSLSEFPVVAFVIGPPEGFSKPISFANEVCSLSKMTFTHEMALLFLTEQLYRSHLIQKGSSYHKS